MVSASDPAAQPLSEDSVEQAEHGQAPIGQDFVEKQEPGEKSSQRSQTSDQRTVKARWERSSKSLADSWLVEGLSLLTSVTLLGGLAGLFGVFSGKATTDYVGYLSFPTVIAIISKAIQVTLMLPVASSISQLGWIHFYKANNLIDLQRFDAASRGLMGNLHLAVAVPSFYAVLSAFIVIAAMGLEAAAQQCLQASPREYIPLLESISMLDYYYFNTGGMVADGIRDAGISAMTSRHLLGDQGSDIPPSLIAGPVLPQSLVYSCTGKGCKPKPYATLSFCSKCEDISDDVVQSGCDDSEGHGDCTLSLPGGPSLKYNIESMVMSTTPIASSHGESWTGELTLAKFTMINQFAVPFDNCVHDQYPYYCWIEYAAHSCSIALCANIYRLDASQGDTGFSGATESPLASETQAAWGYEVIQNGDQPNQGYQPGYHIPIPNRPTHDLSNSEVLNGESATASLGIDQNSTVLLNKYFASLFNGTSLFPPAYMSNGSTAEDAPDLEAADAQRQAAVYAQQQAGAGFWDTFSVTLQSWGYDNTTEATTQVNSVLASIVTSMGNWVRDFYPSFTDFGNYQGQPGALIPVSPSTYKIRWAWLALPFGLEILVLVLLRIAIDLTIHYKLPVWKASSMALLYRGIARGEEGDEAPLEKVSAMETAATSKKVKLEITPDGHRLVVTNNE
jgi:hypothetical protein